MDQKVDSTETRVKGSNIPRHADLRDLLERFEEIGEGTSLAQKFGMVEDFEAFTRGARGRAFQKRGW